MNTNGFREGELIAKQMNGQVKVFPLVGARLRLAHEENDQLSLETEMVSWDGKYAVVKCCATTKKGHFVGYGTANTQRDADFAESLVEVAETRSIARALRFAGFGLEYCGAEEVSHVPSVTSESEQSAGKESKTVFVDSNGNDKPGTKASNDAIDPGGNGSKPQPCGNSRATQAQCRALFALTKRAQYSEQDIESMLHPLHANTFQDLTRESASQLITSLQSPAAA